MSKTTRIIGITLLSLVSLSLVSCGPGDSTTTTGTQKELPAKVFEDEKDNNKEEIMPDKGVEFKPDNSAPVETI